MKIIEDTSKKEDVAVINRIQDSFDCVDVQYDIDRLKAYMELDGDDLY